MTTSVAPSRFVWTLEREETLLSLIIKGIREGDRPGGHFKPQFWNHVAASFFARGLGNPSLKQLRDKRSGWARDWKVWYKLECQSGWGIDPETGLLTAPPGAWDEAIRKWPDAKKFRHKAIPYRDQVFEIFHDVQATGAFSQGGNDVAQQITGIAEDGEDYTPQGDEESQQDLVIEERLQGPPVRVSTPTIVSSSSSSQKRPASSTPAVPSKRRTAGDEVDHSISEYLKTLIAEKKAPAQQQSQTTTKRQAIEILQEEFDEDLSDEEFNRAIAIVEAHSEVFITLKPVRRSRWLSSMLEKEVI
jgi:hypothetical protein